MGSGSSTKDDAAAVDAEGAKVAVTLSIVKMRGRRCDPQVCFYRVGVLLCGLLKLKE